MGRNLEFNRDEALRNAMIVFWERGYDTTKMPVLLKAMQIGKSSLYFSFGNKDQLFEEAIDLYYSEFAAKRDQAMRGASTVKEGFRLFFKDRMRCSANKSLPRGCLLTNTMTSIKSVNPKIAKKLKDSFNKMLLSFREQITKGMKEGSISRDRDPSDLAALVVGFSMGLHVMSQATNDLKILESAIDGFMNSIFE